MIFGLKRIEVLAPGGLSHMLPTFSGPTMMVGLLLSAFVSQSLAQDSRQKWERIFTGDDAIIEVNRSSMTLLENRLVRVSFRTVYKKPQSIPGQANTKYKSQTETTELRLDNLSYRFVETTLLDDSGKEVVTRHAEPNESWRVIRRGGMMEKLFDSVRSIPPFGYWKITGLRYSVEGGNRDFTRLRGTRVILMPESAQVGNQSCSPAHYISESMSTEGFLSKLGISAQSLNITSEPTDAVVIKCPDDSWKSQQSLVLKLRDDQMLLLWNGLFLELKRD